MLVVYALQKQENEKKVMDLVNSEGVLNIIICKILTMRILYQLSAPIFKGFYEADGLHMCLENFAHKVAYNSALLEPLAPECKGWILLKTDIPESLH